MKWRFFANYESDSRASGCEGFGILSPFTVLHTRLAIRNTCGIAIAPSCNMVDSSPRAVVQFFDFNQKKGINLS